jgi:hypothetical protein
MKSYFEILNEAIENIVKKKFISYKGAYGRFLYTVGANSIKLYKFVHLKSAFFIQTSALKKKKVFEDIFYNMHNAYFAPMSNHDGQRTAAEGETR